ncbi:MAG: DUF1566 domain-containing protein, partial [Burkholderiales bacterium]|nr:DUF1566 domain-containing protein [Burkholderiales bacterium]
MKNRGKLILMAGMLGANVAQASLISVGSGLVYDSVANVTWSSDANLLGTMESSTPGLIANIIAMVPVVTDTPNSGDTPANSGHYDVTAADFGANGTADWFGQMAFAQYLNTLNVGQGYLGHNTWILPTTYNQTCVGNNCTNSMMGELFYTGLGGTATQSITTSHNGNFNLFTNVQSNDYWSGTEYIASPGNAWYFSTASGAQNFGTKPGYFNSWVVLSGNASASVPEPA